MIWPVICPSLFIGLNSLSFATVAIFYINIFQIASDSSSSIQSTGKDNELKMAVKMSAVVLTDFFCWVPLAFVCMLVQCGVTTVGPEMYAWTVGLILPINSALNPFLYTIATIIADRLGQKKKEKSLQKQNKLLHDQEE